MSVVSQVAVKFHEPNWQMCVKLSTLKRTLVRFILHFMIKHVITDYLYSHTIKVLTPSITEVESQQTH